MSNKPDTPAEPAKEQKSKTSLKKKLITIFAGILLFFVLVLTLLIIFIEPVIKTAVVNIGPKVAGVPFELEDISVSLLRGRVEIKNLIIGSPKGYAAEYAVKLGDIAVQTDVLSWISGPKAIIREVRLKDITVNYETALPLSTESNLQVILDNVKKLTEKPAPQEKAEPAVEEEPAAKEKAEPAPQEKAEDTAEEKPAPQEKAEDTAEEKPAGKNLQLDKLIIENVRLVVVPKGHPKFGVPLIITLPELGPIGTDPEGTPAPDVAVSLLTEILGKIVDGVKDSSTEIYSNFSKQGMQLTDNLVKDTKKLTGDIAESTGDAIKNVGDKAENAAKEIGDKAENLLKSLRIKK